VFQRILVVWDGTEPAERAFAMGIDVGTRYEAEIVAASVVPPDHPAEQAPARLAELWAQRHAAGDRRGCAVSHKIIEGRHTGADLLAYAHEHAFDLVVIGHHHDPKPGVLVLHGVTEHLISAAELPVLVVGG
jgi:nucleotide-binding universal stress UspA family protein